MSIARGAVFCLVFPFLAGNLHAATLSNGDFSNGLTDWVTNSGNGTVTSVSGAAVLETGPGFDIFDFSASLLQGDDGSFSFLLPAVTVPDDAVSLRFDFQFIDLGADATEAGADAGQFADALLFTVFDKLDANLDIAEFVADSLIPGGPFVLDVSHLAGRDVAISFDLLDQDDGRNSRVIVDNVAFSAVPVPAALWLLPGGLLLLVRRRR